MAKDILSVGGFTIIRRIGNGARSTIYLATDDEDGSTIALKRLIFEKPDDHRYFEQTELEFKVAQEIDVLDVYRRHKEFKPQGIGDLNQGGLQLAKALADEVTPTIDALVSDSKGG